MRIITPNSLLPDTNILVHHVRRSKLDQWIKANYPFGQSDPSPILSIVTVGEIQCLAKRNKWGQAKRQMTEDFVARSQVIPLEEQGLIAAYVELDYRCHRVGRHMGNNDLWIAATAFVTGAVLLTTDKDFDHLSPGYIQREWIDPVTP